MYPRINIPTLTENGSISEGNQKTKPSITGFYFETLTYHGINFAKFRDRRKRQLCDVGAELRRQPFLITRYDSEAKIAWW